MLGTVAGVLGASARVSETAAGGSGMVVFILQTSIIDDKQSAMLVGHNFLFRKNCNSNVEMCLVFT